MSVGLPCSDAARSIVNATYGGATSIVANCDDTHTGPLPTVAVPRTAVFHLRTWALPAAFIGISTSFCFSGMTTDDRRADAGRVEQRHDRDRSGEARLALGRDLEVHRAVLHQRRLRLDNGDFERRLIRDGHRRSIRFVLPVNRLAGIADNQVRI